MQSIVKFAVMIGVVCSFGAPVECGKRLPSKIKRNSQSLFLEQDYNSNSGYYGLYSKFNGRRLALPSGTVLQLTPSINIPLFDNKNENLRAKTNFMASFPLQFIIRDMEVSLLGEELLNGFTTRNAWNGATQSVDSNTVINNDQPYSHSRSRKSRDVSWFIQRNHTSGNSRNNGTTSTSMCRHHQNFIDRQMILQKLQMFASGFGMDDPKACLLRAACEIHESPFNFGLGMLEEVITSIFSVHKLSRKCEPHHFPPSLVPFVEAEKTGKRGKCHVYAQKCPKSLFINE